MKQKIYIKILTAIIMLQSFFVVALVNFDTAFAFPNVSFDKLNSRYYLVSEFETYYNQNVAGRSNNIEVASRKLCGTVIMPHQSISFNQTIGKRSLENGYMQAKIIVDSKYSYGLGGGVCQVSTTLYNAALLAGMKIEEVNAHSLPPAYVAPSFDAMVSGSYFDLVFTNDTDEYFYIESVAGKGKLTVKIFSTAKNKYEIERRSQVLKYLSPPSDVIVEMSQAEAEKLNIGEDGYIVKPKCGIKSVGYIVYRINGHEVSVNKIREDIYRGQEGIKYQPAPPLEIPE